MRRSSPITENALNALDYAETIARFLIGIERNKKKLVLSATQQQDLKESLNNALHKINKAEYVQISKERQAILGTEETSQEKQLARAKVEETYVSGSLSSFPDEDNPSSSYFYYPLSFAKGASTFIHQGISFALENPTQAITMGLAFQAFVVAATSAFSSPQISKNQKIGTDSNYIDLESLSTTQGFVIEGAKQEDYAGGSVSSAGDFNGDGLSDVIIGASQGAYVIYGQKNGYPISFDLASLNVNQGFIIKGAGSSSSAGDFNGDGLSDIIIGDSYTSPQGRRFAGTSYVIYGKKGGYLSPIDLAFLNSPQGVVVEGAKGVEFEGAKGEARKAFFQYGHADMYAGDHLGKSVSSAGDFNGDGVSDIIVGADLANPLERYWAGSSYVIYGQKDAYQAPFGKAKHNEL